MGGLRLGPDGLADAPAVHDGHHHIQQHQIGLDGPELAQSRAAVMGHRHGVALPLQVHLQQLRDILVVFHDQNRNSHMFYLLYMVSFVPLYPILVKVGERFVKKSAAVFFHILRQRCGENVPCIL